jgi:hypothetical protein
VIVGGVVLAGGAADAGAAQTKTATAVAVRNREMRLVLTGSPFQWITG